MSRLRERSDKNCLNCGTEVHGRFCHNCGQENIEAKESVWHLVTHFFKDFTHFDGKFFSTVKYLVTRPGFLPKEYMQGRRTSYVNPVRFYIFTSAFFFLIFFTFTKADKRTIEEGITMNGKTYEQVMSMDSATYDAFVRQRFKKASAASKENMPLNKADFKAYFDSSVNKGINFFNNADYKTKQEYDAALAAGKKESWLRRQAIYKEIELNEKYKDNFGQLFQDLYYTVVHSLPQMFFVLLPLFALILKILYIRRKNFYYVDHAIFSVHYYIFTFLLLLFVLGFNLLGDTLGWRIFDYLQGLLFLILFLYLYKAMRNFYEQRRAKTMLKFFILCLSLFVALTGLFILFIIFSFFKL